MLDKFLDKLDELKDIVEKNGFRGDTLIVSTDVERGLSKIYKLEISLKKVVDIKGE